MDRKFNVIRIPIKYTKQMDILTEKQQLYIYKSLGALGRGEIIEQRDTMEFYILCNIFEEWMSMESKNGNKSEKSLTKYLSELPAQVNPSDSESIVQYNTIQDSTVQNNKPAKQVFQEDSFEYTICKLFLDFHIKEQTPSIIYLLNKKSESDILNKWCDEIRKLKEIDKFTEEQISYIIRYTIKDEFWKNQILSIDKFRKTKDGVSYFVRMIDKAKQGSEPKRQDSMIITNEF